MTNATIDMRWFTTNAITVPLIIGDTYVKTHGDVENVVLI